MQASQILGSINAGAINDKGVHGLADSLHISERQLRRIVQSKTGNSPMGLNKARRLSAAELLVTQTKLSIIDIAFIAEFSSLRQFNDVFKDAFQSTPRQMRQTAARKPFKTFSEIVLPLKLCYKALLHTPVRHQLTNQLIG
jgi:AraC family transcriptional regulator of adaptative response / DNA-3-methyladenine glycosylase II